MPRYILQLRDLLISENTDQRFTQLLWFMHSTVLSDIEATNNAQHKNWFMAMNFYFDRLLSKTDQLAIYEVIQSYRNEQQTIDEYIESAMAEFISELQGKRDQLRSINRMYPNKKSMISAYELKVASHEIIRLLECRTQFILTALFHFRILSQFSADDNLWQHSSHLIQETTMNLQIMLGLSFIVSQPVINNLTTANLDNLACLSLTSTNDEISVAVIVPYFRMTSYSTS